MYTASVYMYEIDGEGFFEEEFISENEVIIKQKIMEYINEYKEPNYFIKVIYEKDGVYIDQDEFNTDDNGDICVEGLKAMA